MTSHRGKPKELNDNEWVRYDTRDGPKGGTTARACNAPWPEITEWERVGPPEPAKPFASIFRAHDGEQIPDGVTPDDVVEYRKSPSDAVWWDRAADVPWRLVTSWRFRQEGSDARPATLPHPDVTLSLAPPGAKPAVSSLEAKLVEALGALTLGDLAASPRVEAVGMAWAKLQAARRGP